MGCLGLPSFPALWTTPWSPKEPHDEVQWQQVSRVEVQRSSMGKNLLNWVIPQNTFLSNIL